MYILLKILYCMVISFQHDGHQPTDKCMLEENMKLENIIETLKQENM